MNTVRQKLLMISTILRIIKHYMFIPVFIMFFIMLISFVVNTGTNTGLAGQPVEINRYITIFAILVMVIVSAVGVFSTIKRDIKAYKIRRFGREHKG